VALTAAPTVHIERFRAKTTSSALNEEIGRAVHLEGGEALLVRINRQFTDYVARRPHARRINTDQLDLVGTYDALLSALDEVSG